jgi:hypothetical protein
MIREASPIHVRSVKPFGISKNGEEEARQWRGCQVRAPPR